MIADRAGDAVLVIDSRTGAVVHANRWASKMTGLKTGGTLPRVAVASPLEFPSLGWIQQVLEGASRGRMVRTCIVWDPPDFSRRRSRLLEVIAVREKEEPSRVAITMRRVMSGKDLEHNLWRRNHELRTLNRASRRVSRSLDVGQVTEASLEASMELCDARWAVAYLFDEAGRLEQRAVSGSLPGEVLPPQPGEESVAAAVIESGEPAAAIEQWRLESDPDGFHCCTLTIPLRTPERVLGLIRLACGEKFIVTGYDRSVVSSFGFQVGTALDNALLHQQIRAASERDALTGVFNRRHLESLMARTVARSRRYREEFAVLMVDIDRFKSINDVHSHEKGDQTLQRVAQVLVSDLRDSDYVGRWGGEEFVIVLAEVTEARALEIAERVRARVAAIALACDDGAEVPITVSIGVACYPLHGDSIERLIRSSDDAMLQAKRDGRDTITLYSPTMSRTVEPANEVVNVSMVASGTIRALAAAVDAKDSYTARHSEAVRRLARALALRLEIEAGRIETLESAALLHDIGKVSVPDLVLN
ncbi:MAG: diguanylate cyclase, partial [Pseudomonadota bacterium]